MTREKKSVWVTGRGALTSAGLNPQDLWKNILAGRSGIQEGGLGPLPPTWSRNPVKLLLDTADQAMADAGWDHLSEEDAIVFATTTGQVALWEEPLMKLGRGEISEATFSTHFRDEPLGITLRALREKHQFKGRVQLLSTACSASTHAIGLAALWIRHGIVRRCLVGGSDTLSRLTVDGFRSFQLVSNSVAKPFDVARNGINLSEGAGFLCLEADPKKDPLARISGVGFTNDAYHMTAPHPEGRGSFVAMKRALEDAGLSPEEICWVHAHGTGSLHNDAAESNAIRMLFGEKARVSSTKGIHGHTLAAAGAIETIVDIAAIGGQTIPGTFGLENPDPKLGILPLLKSESIQVRHVMKNTLGFGGSNGSLVISSVEGAVR